MYFYGILHFIYKVNMIIILVEIINHNISLYLAFSKDYNGIEIPLPQVIFQLFLVEMLCKSYFTWMKQII